MMYADAARQSRIAEDVLLLGRSCGVLSDRIFLVPWKLNYYKQLTIPTSSIDI